MWEDVQTCNSHTIIHQHKKENFSRALIAQMFWRFYGVLSLDFKAIFFFIPGGKAYAFNSITINQIIDQGFLVFLCTFFFFLSGTAMVLNVCKVSTKGFCNLIFLWRLEAARYSASRWKLAGSHPVLLSLSSPRPPAPALLIRWLYLPYISPVKLLGGYRREKEENQLRYKPAHLPECLSFSRLSCLYCCTPSCHS